MTTALSIVSLKEFKKLEEEKQKEILTEYLGIFKPKKLAEQWDCNAQVVYNWRSKLNITNKRKDKNDILRDSIEDKENNLIMFPKEEQIIQQEIKQLNTKVSDLDNEVVETTNVQEQKKLQLENKNEEKELVFEKKKIDYVDLTKEIINQIRPHKDVVFSLSREYEKEILSQLPQAIELIVEEGFSYEMQFQLIKKGEKLSNKEKEIVQTKTVVSVVNEQNTQQLKTEISDIQLNLLEQQEQQEEIKQLLINQQEQFAFLREQLEKGVNEEEIQKIVKHLENLNQKTSEIKKDFEWISGYNSVKTDKVGLHEPKSEYKTAPQPKKKELQGTYTEKKDLSLVNTPQGQTLYQTYYVCVSCNNKGKAYVEKDSKEVQCKTCRHSMPVRNATPNGFPEKDPFGNHFVAGKFKSTIK